MAKSNVQSLISFFLKTKKKTNNKLNLTNAAKFLTPRKQKKLFFNRFRALDEDSNYYNFFFCFSLKPKSSLNRVTHERVVKLCNNSRLLQRNSDHHLRLKMRSQGSPLPPPQNISEGNSIHLEIWSPTTEISFPFTVIYENYCFYQKTSLNSY